MHWNLVIFIKYTIVYIIIKYTDTISTLCFSLILDFSVSPTKAFGDRTQTGPDGTNLAQVWQSAGDLLPQDRNHGNSWCTAQTRHATAAAGPARVAAIAGQQRLGGAVGQQHVRVALQHPTGRRHLSHGLVSASQLPVRLPECWVSSHRLLFQWRSHHDRNERHEGWYYCCNRVQFHFKCSH